MTFATYLIELFWPCADVGTDKGFATQLIAVTTYLLLTALNCYQIKHVVRVIDFFSVTKSIALCVIIVSGFVWLAQGRTENLTGLFENSSDSPGNYALAFYSVSISVIEHSQSFLRNCFTVKLFKDLICVDI